MVPIKKNIMYVIEKQYNMFGQVLAGQQSQAPMFGSILGGGGPGLLQRFGKILSSAVESPEVQKFAKGYGITDLPGLAQQAKDVYGQGKTFVSGVTQFAKQLAPGIRRIFQK